MKKLRWGIISTGTIAKVFAKTVTEMKRKNENIELYGVASRNIENAELFAKQYDIAKAYDSYEKLAADENIDAVYIGTPNNLHYENMMTCIEHGKHVLCEKPFTVNAKEATEVYAYAKEKNVFVMEAFWTKFIPIYREVEKIIASGIIGDVRIVTSQYGFCTGGERAQRKFDPTLAGGALLDIGVYNIGFAAMILGYNPIRIQSSVGMNAVGTDDYSGILLEYENGSIAQLTTAIQTQIPVLGCVYGSLGYIQIKDFKNPQRVEIVLNNGHSYQVEQVFEINGYEYEIREVANCIERGQQYSAILTPEQSVAMMEIMDQVRNIWNMKYPFEKHGTM